MNLLATEIDAGISSRLREIAGLQAARQVQPPGYSLRRVVDALVGKRRLTGYEAEVHQELVSVFGEPSSPNSVIVPWGVLSAGRRDMTAAGVSGSNYLIGTEPALPVVDALRPWSVVVQAGMTVVGGLRSNVTVPRVATASSGAWLADEATAITGGQAVIGQISASPKTAMAYCEISHQLAAAAPDVEQLLLGELGRTLGALVDAAVLGGSGTAGQPMGLAGTPGTQTQAGADLAWAGVCNIEQTCADANMTDASAAWISTPSVRELLRQREVAAGAGAIWNGGTMAGKPAFVTTACPAVTAFLGNWSDAVLFVWGGGIELMANPFSDFAKGIIGLRAMIHCDVAFLHPAGFGVVSSIT